MHCVLGQTSSPMSLPLSPSSPNTALAPNEARSVLSELHSRLVHQATEPLLKPEMCALASRQRMPTRSSIEKVRPSHVPGSMWMRLPCHGLRVEALTPSCAGLDLCLNATRTHQRTQVDERSNKHAEDQTKAAATVPRSVHGAVGPRRARGVEMRARSTRLPRVATRQQVNGDASGMGTLMPPFRAICSFVT